jgi:predicted  nucleic acid-binding Zn-ribbon protein
MSVQNGDPGIQKPIFPEKSLVPEPVKLIVMIILVLAVIYLFYINRQNKNAFTSELDRISEQIQTLENHSKLAEASLSGQIAGLSDELHGAQDAVASTKTELRRTIQEDRKKTKEGLDQAMAATAQVKEQVQKTKSEAESKITQVNTEVGGVKSDVVEVKTDLEDTRRELEGAQKRLASVGETLGAAIAKNASELEQLRLKGERDYYEFEFPKKNRIIKVEDIRLVLTKTDQKKGKYNMKIIADDSEIEKKDLLINEPVQFLVGRNRVRYEAVINWVEKDKAGGYLAVPKDKTLSSAGVPKSQ